MSTKLSSLIGDTSLTFGQRVVAAICQLGFIMLVARYLGVKGNGEFAVAVLVPVVLTRLLMFGLNFSMIYHISHGKISLRFCIVSSLCAISASSFIAFVITLAVLMPWNDTLFPDSDISLIYTALWFYPFSVAHVYIANLLIGLYEIPKYNLAMLLPPATRLIICVGLLLLGEFTIATAIMAWGLSLALACVVGSSQIAVIYFRQPKSKIQDQATVSEWFAYAIRYYFYQIFLFLTLRSDVFLVNYFLGPSSTGIYSIALQICDRIMMLPRSLAAVLFPRLGKLEKSEQDKRRYVQILASATLYIAVGMIAVVFFLAEPAIIILFGHDYAPATQVLWVLLPGVIAISVTKIQGLYLSTLGHPGLNSVREGICFFLNLALNVALIPEFGIIGAAAATSIAYGASLVISVFIFARYTKTKPAAGLFVNRDLVEISIRTLKKLRK